MSTNDHKIVVLKQKSLIELQNIHSAFMREHI